MATQLALRCQLQPTTNHCMKKSHPIPVRLDLDVKDALEADAEAQERSQAWLINRILRDYYGLQIAKAPKAKPARGN